MKKRRFWVSLVLLSLLVALLPIEALSAEQVEIPVGTLVTLSLTKELTTKDAPVGTTVFLNVTQDVVVKGKVVIKAAAIGTATVANAKDAGYLGTPGQLGITLISVQGIDGTQVPVAGNRMVEASSSTVASAGLSLFICPLFVFMKGKEATLPAGTLFEARTNGTVTVTIP